MMKCKCFTVAPNTRKLSRGSVTTFKRWGWVGEIDESSDKNPGSQGGVMNPLTLVGQSHSPSFY